MAGDCCSKPLPAGELEAGQRRVLVWVLLINVAAFVMMVTGSLLSGSSSLLSGTLDNLGDALTYALSLAVVGASIAARARVALFKGVLISLAAITVAAHILWRLQHPGVPVVETMGVAAVLNLAANSVCLLLLSRYRDDDVNMASVWECSRNDVVEGFAVIGATLAVWLFDSAWPDIVVAVFLLGVFSRSAARVLGRAWRELKSANAQPSCGSAPS